MTITILAASAVQANVKLLEVRLLAEYFDVLTATNGPDALETCGNGKVDVVLLDVMMPGMDGFEVCRRLKGNAATSHIPIVMLTALDQVSDRIRGLEAGADDFLTKPVNELALMTRVKSLVRLKMLTDELRLRASMTRHMGIKELLSRGAISADERALVMLVDENAASSERIAGMLCGSVELTVIADPKAALFEASEKPYECVISSSRFAGYDPLRLCSQIRSYDSTRSIPILLLADQGQEERIIRGLELGINDYLTRPIDPQELVARLRTQMKRKRFNDYLRASVEETMRWPFIDISTELHNRRYLELHTESLFIKAVRENRPLSVIFIDIDHLKCINDTYGHAAGGDMLREIARRLRANVRRTDLACHYGGDEFVVVMPDTTRDVAASLAERIRQSISTEPIDISGDQPKISITASIGVAALDGIEKSAAELLNKADVAMYSAKNAGRDRVAIAI